MSLALPLSIPPVGARAAATRAVLVGALGAVDGLSSGSAAPDVATPGAAWPRWVQSTYHGNLDTVAEDAYDVFVVLPADYLNTTVDEGDRLRDAVELALWPVATITRSEPVAIAFDDGQSMPGIRFRVAVN